MNNKEKLYLIKQGRYPVNSGYSGSRGEGRIARPSHNYVGDAMEDSIYHDGSRKSFRRNMLGGGGAGAGISALLGALYGGIKKPDEEKDESRLGNAAKYGLGGAALGGVSGAGLAGIDELASKLYNAEISRQRIAEKSFRRDYANQEQLYDTTRDTHEGIRRIKEMLTGE